MQNTVKEYAITESTLNRARKIQSDKKFRKLLAENNLLMDYDVVFLAMDYMAKTGMKFRMDKSEFLSCQVLLSEIDKAYKGEINVSELNSMQNFARLTHYQSLLYINLAKRKGVIENIDPKKRKDKKLCKRLTDEYENLSAILSARVVKNYYDFASTRDAVKIQGDTITNDQDSLNDIIVGNVNLSKVLKQLYKNKVSKNYVVNNLPEREEAFKRELPRFVKDNQTIFNAVTWEIYKDMFNEVNLVNAGKEYSQDVTNFHLEPNVKASKIGKQLTAGALTLAILSQSLAGPIHQILNKFEDTPSVNVPSDPNVNKNEENKEPSNKWGENVVVTDDANKVAPNEAEENEEVAGNVGDITPDEDKTNDTILPELDPDNGNGNLPSVDYDSPEEKPVVGADKDNQKQEAEGPADDREDNFWIMN